jgi:hypothetical protein
LSIQVMKPSRSGFTWWRPGILIPRSISPSRPYGRSISTTNDGISLTYAKSPNRGSMTCSAMPRHSVSAVTTCPHPSNQQLHVTRQNHPFSLKAARLYLLSVRNRYPWRQLLLHKLYHSQGLLPACHSRASCHSDAPEAPLPRERNQ